MSSIKWKMASLYMLLVVTVMIGCGAFILVTLRENAYQDVFHECQYTAERIIDALSMRDIEDEEGLREAFGENVVAFMVESVGAAGNDLSQEGVKSAYLLSEEAALLYARRDDLPEEALSSRAVAMALAGETMQELYVHTESATSGEIAEYAQRFWLRFENKAEETAYLILIRQSLESVQEDLRSITRAILIITVLGILIAGLLGYLLAVSISRPILHLTEKTKELASGRLETALEREEKRPSGPERAQDELDQLEVNFDEMARELSSSILELRAMEKMQKEFVANVSHELRTPITTVKSYVETLLDNPGTDEKTKKQFLSVVNTEADRMTALIADLLELSRMDSHQTAFSPRPIDMGEVLRKNLVEIQREAQKKGQTVRWEETMLCEPSEEGEAGKGSRLFPLARPFWVLGEARRLDQVLRNLLMNAVKYSLESGQIFGGILSDRKRIEVTIRDTGIGISEEDQKHIFERFYRADKARSRAMGGTGLGLAIAKEITELHGGSIRVESVPMEGSRFTVTLPEMSSEEVEAWNEENRAKEPPGESHG